MVEATTARRCVPKVHMVAISTANGRKQLTHGGQPLHPGGQHSVDKKDDVNREVHDNATKQVFLFAHPLLCRWTAAREHEQLQ